MWCDMRRSALNQAAPSVQSTSTAATAYISSPSASAYDSFFATISGTRDAVNAAVTASTPDGATQANIRSVQNSAAAMSAALSASNDLDTQLQAVVTAVDALRQQFNTLAPADDLSSLVTASKAAVDLFPPNPQAVSRRGCTRSSSQCDTYPPAPCMVMCVVVAREVRMLLFEIYLVLPTP